RSGRPDVLWTKLPGFVSAHRRLCQQDSARGEAGRHSGRAADQIRSRRERAYGRSPRHYPAADAARPRRRGDRMIQRRDFIALLGGAAAVWPLAARAQQAGRLPTIGVLGTSTPSGWREWTAAFVRRLNELGWTEGRTVAIEMRWAHGRSESFAEIA